MRAVKCILVFALVFGYFNSTAQDNRRAYLTLDVSFGGAILNFNTTLDKGSGSSSSLINYNVDKPVYRGVDTISLIGNVLFHVGADIPFYRAQNYSVGCHLNVGIGAQYGSINPDEYFSPVSDLPQFLYYKRRINGADLGLLLGYRSLYSKLPYSMPLFGVEYSPNQDFSVRVTNTLVRHRYYYEIPSGDIIPAMKIRDIQFSVIWRITQNHDYELSD